MFCEWDLTGLQKWKKHRVNDTLRFLQHNSRDSLRYYLSHLSSLVADVSPRWEAVSDIALEASRAFAAVDYHLVYAFEKIAYIASRENSHALDRFMQHALSRYSKIQTNFDMSFTISSGSSSIIPKLVRQCRPNLQSYPLEATKQVGFYNKNRDFIYNNYNKSEAEIYIGKNFGEYVLKIFSSIEVPQAQSDFFLMASLYLEGGVSVDVCSVNRARFAPLLGCGQTLGFVVGKNGPEKKFFFSTPRHPFVKVYFERLINYMEVVNSGKCSFSYDDFSGQRAFQRFVMDVICDLEDDFDNSSLTFTKPSLINSSKNTNVIDFSSIALIEDSVYSAFIDAVQDEEALSFEDDQLSFGRSRLSGISDDLDICPSFRGRERGPTIIATRPDYYFAASDHVSVIGSDSIPEISRQARAPFAAPAVHLFQLYDVDLSGHGCLWKGNKFLRLESYLSFVAEQEVLGGHWPGPHKSASVTREVEEPVIIAFGAGHGCYGHYLVDDLPRLGLARLLLGDAAFKSRKIVIPVKTPKWGIKLLQEILQLQEDSFLFFDHETEFWHFKDAIVPSYLSRHYQFHPMLRTFYQSLVPDVGKPWRRICLSRKAWEPQKVNQRVFLQQEMFESIARERGFDIVAAETMTISDQIRLLAETRCQIGEHGSAQHASVYNKHGMTIGTINPRTEVQCNLGRLYGDHNIIAYEDSSYQDDNGNTFYSLNENKISQFFDAVESVDKSRDVLYNYTN